MKINPKLLNGHPKVTIIESFDKRVKLLRQVNHQLLVMEFKDVGECRRHIENNRFEVNICHLHGDYSGPSKGDK